jgi:hypothetical protein
MKNFFRTRRKVLIGFLISLGAFMFFVIVTFHFRYGNELLLVLKLPFALLIPAFWPRDETFLAFNFLISALPLVGMILALVQPRNGNMVAVAHISLVLYWTCVFYSINP